MVLLLRRRPSINAPDQAAGKLAVKGVGAAPISLSGRQKVRSCFADTQTVSAPDTCSAWLQVPPPPRQQQPGLKELLRAVPKAAVVVVAAESSWEEDIPGLTG